MSEKEVLSNIKVSLVLSLTVDCVSKEALS
jgi:hypothetical protein